MLRRNFSKFYILVGLVAAIVLLIFFNSIGWLERPKELFYSVSAPILKPFQYLGGRVSSTVKLLSDLKSLAQENSRLKQENQQLFLKVSELSEVLRQNDLLRQQLQIKPPLKSKMLLADIVGFDPSNFSQYFLINKGKQEGVSLGQAVIFAGGFLVGKISETEDHLSKALLLIDSNSSVFALTQEARISGVVKGEHGVGLIMEIIPQQKEIKEGETIISSGLDGFIPKGLVIGQLGKKISLESEAFQKFEIKPSVNYKELDTVFVILGNE